MAITELARLLGGIESLKPGKVYHDLKTLLEKCRSFGLFLVPCGELEDWIPTQMSGGPSKQKKSEWANAAANTIRRLPVEKDDIWGFIQEMGRYQKDQISRLRYPI
ncbi:MAG TPA: hypothetical protein DD670_09410 [Planctomycetaceae bacterium]|nr:hypothetical protein [Planctomycetaceae bacterium]